MTELHKSESNITRRTVAKGAAWSVPVIALGAGAAQAAASGPTCEPCLGASVVSASATVATVNNNKGNVLIGGVFTALATSCTGLITAGVATINSATLTMSDGKSYTTTTGLTGGPMVGGLIALGSGITFGGVDFPDGVYIAGSNPVSLVSLCFDVVIPLQIGGVSTPCGQKVCFKPTVALGLGTVGALTHDGVVTYTTAWTLLS